MHGRLYRWTENSFPFFFYLQPVEISKKYFNITWTYLKVTLTSMGAELQSINHVDIDCGKTTGPIYLKFWHKFLLMGTIEIQK